MADQFRRRRDPAALGIVLPPLVGGIHQAVLDGRGVQPGHGEDVDAAQAGDDAVVRCRAHFTQVVVGDIRYRLGPAAACGKQRDGEE
jgi:hypothetical protein